MMFRDARREDVPAIVALLADDALGAEREGAVDDRYLVAFEQVQADPGSRQASLVAGDAAGDAVVGRAMLLRFA
jgi:hypothetical protein